MYADSDEESAPPKVKIPEEEEEEKKSTKRTKEVKSGAMCVAMQNVEL